MPHIPVCRVNALDNVNVDYLCVRCGDGADAPTLVSQPHGRSNAVQIDVRTEALLPNGS